MNSEWFETNSIDKVKVNDLTRAVNANDAVSGLTHNLYRYPARFSPLFAREIIRTWSRPGDIVFDPFMGGGTTLVEARALGRSGIGTDISSLAVFLAKAKTTTYRQSDFEAVRAWTESVLPDLNLRNKPVRAAHWIAMGYQENLNTRSTWPVRKTIELALSRVRQLPTLKQKRLVRCCLLRIAQWALDCRTRIPSAEELRQQLMICLNEAIEGAIRFSDAVRESERACGVHGTNSFCLHRSVVGIESDKRMSQLPTPSLILTSPPYPGVHVLYHRWQINGRKETPAPFWIANCHDGCGASFYTFGDRREKGLVRYFETARQAYKSVAAIAGKQTLMVQLVAFANPKWQLPKFLDVLQDSGFEEIKVVHGFSYPDGRLWRTVPNRKWYATAKGPTDSSKEVVLFHRLSR